MIWRGPMVMSAITQMLREVAWGDLDVLVVDGAPAPATASAMAQATPLAGAVIVSITQDLALIDARRGVSMFKRVEIPILGIVENMATFVCPHCGQESHIFRTAAPGKKPSAWTCPSSARCPQHDDPRIVRCGTPRCGRRSRGAACDNLQGHGAAGPKYPEALPPPAPRIVIYERASHATAHPRGHPGRRPVAAHNR